MVQWGGYLMLICLFFLSLFWSSSLVAETTTYLPEHEFVTPVLFESRYLNHEVSFVHTNPAKLSTAEVPQLALDSAQNFFGYTQFRAGYVKPYESFSFGFGYSTVRTDDILLSEKVEGERPVSSGRASHRFSMYRINLAFDINEKVHVGMNLATLSQRLVSSEASGSKFDLGFLYDVSDSLWVSVLFENLLAGDMSWAGATDAIEPRTIVEIGGRKGRLESAFKTTGKRHRVMANYGLHRNVHLVGDYMLAKNNVKRMSYGVLLNFGVLGVQYLHLQTISQDLDVDQDTLGLLYRF